MLAFLLHVAQASFSTSRLQETFCSVLDQIAEKYVFMLLSTSLLACHRKATKEIC